MHLNFRIRLHELLSLGIKLQQISPNDETITKPYLLAFGDGCYETIVQVQGKYDYLVPICHLPEHFKESSALYDFYSASDSPKVEIEHHLLVSLNQDIGYLCELPHRRYLR